MGSLHFRQGNPKEDLTENGGAETAPKTGEHCTPRLVLDRLLSRGKISLSLTLHAAFALQARSLEVEAP